ncbi:MAG: 1-deoxy-D-xylulose-5-phosphate synthase [Acidimicrobiia bacterium]|nr:1-deoxy-D-xylulose-5-phosphate synthase [Acidimicrobiia bacterium]
MTYPDTPRLDTIRGPADLRSLGIEELEELATEIRNLIVATVTRNGGHLGSNLGIVELTLALHRVYRSPHDAILFDTGHQAYPHKLLTGRRRRFSTLRLPDGLSGYPSRAESEHDWIENSHASTALSYSHGLAAAFRAGGDDRRVVAVVGDGALTGGMALEGLNNIGHSNADVTIVLNDNGRSYAPTISKLSESLIKLRTTTVYERSQGVARSIAESIPWVADLVSRGIDATEVAIRHMWEPPQIFEQLGIRYFGPFNGHDLPELERILKKVRAMSGPTVVHVITQKGRGYAPAENDPIKAMHDLSSIKEGSYTSAFADHLLTLAIHHPELVAITAAMPDSTGVLPFQNRFPDRVFDVGIAEQHAVAMATGMAMGGLRPVVAIYSTFLTRALDQINLDTALHGCPVIFCLDRAGITGDDGASHHGLLDMVLLSKIPGMTIFAPASYEELPVMLDTALEITTGPSAIRWSKTPAPRASIDEVGSGLSARRVRQGSDVCLIGIGKMLATACEAADLLELEGVSCSVWDPRVVKPLDPVMISDASDHGLVVTAEDGLRAGGIGQAIRDQVDGAGSARVVTIGLPTAHLPHGKIDELLARYRMDASGIVSAVKEHLHTAVF